MKNQHEMVNSIDYLLAEIDAHWAWLPSDYDIDVSSSHWYKFGGGKRDGRQAKLVRKIKRELNRLRELDNA